MNKSWRWMALGALALVLTAGALLLARNTFANGSFASPATDLANTNWSLVSINGQAPIAGRALTLNFRSGGQLVGDSGCNGYGGHYQVNGSTIAISQLVSTLRACAEQPLNDREAAFQKALSAAAQFSLQGERLTFMDAGGGQVLVFQKQ
jgi:heat shock protein HslJ